jgi:hypothetical protein
VKQKGYLSYIIPNKFLISKYSTSILEIIHNQYSFEKIIDYSNVNVFKDASVYPIVVLIRNLNNQREIVDRLLVEEASLENFSLVRKWNFINLTYQDKYNLKLNSIVKKIESE